MKGKRNKDRKSVYHTFPGIVLHLLATQLLLIAASRSLVIIVSFHKFKLSSYISFTVLRLIKCLVGGSNNPHIAQSIPLTCVTRPMPCSTTSSYSTTDGLELKHTCSRRPFSVLIVRSVQRLYRERKGTCFEAYKNTSW